LWPASLWQAGLIAPKFFPFPPSADTDLQHICMNSRGLRVFCDEGVKKLRNHYRPERHYMRGPGPKWQEKHAAALVSAASAQLQSGPASPSRHARKQVHTHAMWILPAAMVLIGLAAAVALA
jgi:hypothetical protein